MASKEELKVLAIADFVKTKFKANLIRKADVIQLLLMAARSVRDDTNNEVPASWIRPELVALYDQSNVEGPAHADHKKSLTIIK